MFNLINFLTGGALSNIEVFDIFKKILISSFGKNLNVLNLFEVNTILIFLTKKLKRKPLKCTPN